MLILITLNNKVHFIKNIKDGGAPEKIKRDRYTSQLHSLEIKNSKLPYILHINMNKTKA